MTAVLQIEGPFTLGDRSAVFAHVNAVMAALKSSGIVPRDRSPVSAFSEVVYASGLASPAAFVVFYEIDLHDDPARQLRRMIWIDLVHTAPAARRRGYATALIGEVLRVAARRGVSRVEFGTGIDNVAMRRTGEKAGFITQSVVLAAAVPTVRHAGVAS